jgi:predicted PurR-regulated permease PerM
MAVKEMELNEKLIKEISAIAVIILFGILVFFTIKPIIFAILWGLILAYAFMPVYSWIDTRLKNKTLSSISTLLLGIIVILLPLWFLMPVMVQQVFEIFRISQTLDISGFVSSIFPTASAQFINQVSIASATIISKMSSYILNSLTNVFLDIPYLLIELLIVCFVFFFALRDSGKISGFIKAISPLSPSKEKLLAKQFKDITHSIIYGIFVVGLLQGLLAGLGFFVFGVQNALVLTVLAILFAILPVAGVFLIWVPVTIYMFAEGNIALGITFLLYNLLIVTSADNILRAYIISKRTNLSPVFVLVSAVGGLFLFGIIGIILGPLIFAYFIILMDMYRERNLLSLFFREEDDKKPESK